MNNGALGFNPEEVKQTVREIRQIFDEIYRCNYAIKNGPLHQLESSWFAPQAVSFGQFFNSRASELGNKIYFMQQDLAVCIISAFNAWANATQSQESNFDYDIRSVDSKIYTISSEFFPDKNGFIGISHFSGSSFLITDTVSDFTKYYERIQEELGKLELAVAKHNGFVGGDQAANLKVRINEMKANVGLLVEELKLFITNKVKETEEKYMQTAQANAQRFASGN